MPTSNQRLDCPYIIAPAVAISRRAVLKAKYRHACALLMARSEGSWKKSSSINLRS